MCPLQNFVETTLVIAVAMLSVYAFIESKRKTEISSSFGANVTPGGMQATKTRSET